MRNERGRDTQRLTLKRPNQLSDLGGLPPPSHEGKEQEADGFFLRMTSGVRGKPGDKKVRRALIPPIRRSGAKVEPYFVVDRYVEYRRRAAEFSPQLKNGGAVFHRLRRAFDLDLIQLVKVCFHRPICNARNDAMVWTFQTTGGGSKSPEGVARRDGVEQSEPSRPTGRNKIGTPRRIRASRCLTAVLPCGTALVPTAGSLICQKSCHGPVVCGSAMA